MTGERKKLQKKALKQSPFRLEAIIPVAMICLVTGLYFSFWFDSHLRYLIEFTATYVHGAEVKVSSVKTSVLKGSLHLYDIQVTDKKDPMRNLIQIGEIRLHLLWDALFKAKFVVNEARIENIQVYSPRKYPGKIILKSEVKRKSEILIKLESEVTDQFKTDSEGNILGNLTGILKGIGPKKQLKSIENKLKASIRMKELEETLQEKENTWDKRLKSLPQRENLKSFEQRVKAVKLDTKNPVQFAKTLKEIKSLVREADQKIKLIKDTTNNLNSDIQMVDKSFKELDQLVKQDIKDFENHFKLTKLNVNADDFSKKLFGKIFGEKLAVINKYTALAREYMPPKKSAEKTAAIEAKRIAPRPRGSGKNYQFPITKSYPLFWLKKAIVSSELNQGEYSGIIRGEIRNITSDPVQLGKPTLMNLEGNFPKQQIFGFKVQLTMDHTTDKPKDYLYVTLGKFPVGTQKILDNKDLTFFIKKSEGHSKIQAVLENKQLHITAYNEFVNMDYEINAKSGRVKEILTNIMAGIPMMTVNAKASGTWNKLNINLHSNLGREIYKGFRTQIQKQIDKNHAKLQVMINDKIGTQRAQLTKQFDAIKVKINRELSKVKGEFEEIKNSAKNQLRGNKKSTKKELQQQGKKLLKNLNLKDFF